jgi:WbqC-like protein family
MIVAAHQPHYLPWLGYLAKVAAADLFVVMDDLQYEAQNFQNRNRLKLNHGAQWLTVPLERGPQDERILDKRIANRGSPKEHWQRRTWHTLRIHYGGAPYWKHYEAELEDVFTRPWERLVDLDLHMLILHLDWFRIRKPVLRASSLALEGQKTDRLEQLCLVVGADTYLSGGGGSRGYLDVAQLARAGIRVAWQQFQHPVYPQRYPALGFVSHLGAIDMLLNCGPEESARLLRVAMEPEGDRVEAAAR